MATHFGDTGRAQALPLSLIAQAVPMLTRHELEALTETLIERIDQLDPDPDLEDDNEDCCPAADDGTAPVWRDGYIRWGSEHDDQGF